MSSLFKKQAELVAFLIFFFFFFFFGDGPGVINPSGVQPVRGYYVERPETPLRHS